MQEDAYEMGQVVLEFLHVWPLAGLWVSQGLRLHGHLARKSTVAARSDDYFILHMTALLTMHQLRSNVGHRSGTLVPAKCTRSYSDNLGLVLSRWAHHDSP